MILNIIIIKKRYLGEERRGGVPSFNQPTVAADELTGKQSERGGGEKRSRTEEDDEMELNVRSLGGGESDGSGGSRGRGEGGGEGGGEGS